MTRRGLSLMRAITFASSPVISISRRAPVLFCVTQQRAVSNVATTQLDHIGWPLAGQKRQVHSVDHRRWRRNRPTCSVPRVCAASSVKVEILEKMEDARMSKKIFISHAAKDKTLADALVDLLQTGANVSSDDKEVRRTSGG